MFKRYQFIEATLYKLELCTVLRVIIAEMSLKPAISCIRDSLLEKKFALPLNQKTKDKNHIFCITLHANFQGHLIYFKYFLRSYSMASYFIFFFLIRHYLKCLLCGYFHHLKTQYAVQIKFTQSYKTLNFVLIHTVFT